MENRRWLWMALIAWGAISVIWTVLDMAALGWNHSRGSMWFNLIMGALVLVIGIYRLLGGRSIPQLARAHERNPSNPSTPT